MTATDAIRIRAGIAKADALVAHTDALLARIDRLDRPFRRRHHEPGGPTMTDDDQDELEAIRTEVGGIAAGMNDFIRGLREQSSYAKRSRVALWLVAVSVVFDLGLSVALGVVAVRANTAAQIASSASRVAQTACIADNEQSAKQVALWEFAFALGGDTPQTPEQQARSDAFREFIGRTFAQRDCERL